MEEADQSTMSPGAPRNLPVTSKTAIPTNKIWYNGRSREARIDPDARISVVVEMMATAFETKEHHITLCLRDESDRLVTTNNLKHRVTGKSELRLCASPMTEALAVVDSLRAASQLPTLTNESSLTLNTTLISNTDRKVLPLKMALFNLQKYIKEGEFVVEFMLKGGLKLLMALLERSSGGLTGNSLAYALQGVRGVLEFESSWADITEAFVDRVLHLLVSAGQPNVIRPATAIVRKLVISSPHFSGDIHNPKSPGPKIRRKSKGKEKEKVSEKGTPATTHSLVMSPVPGQEQPINYYGFERIFMRMCLVGDTLDGEEGTGGERFFRIIIKRLEGTGDLELVAQSLGLVHICLRFGEREESRLYKDLVTILENLHIRRYVSRLMPSCQNNTVSPQILTFQARYAAILNQRRTKHVRPAQDAAQEKMLNEIWHVGRLGEEIRQPGLETITNSGNHAEHSTSMIAGRDWLGWRRLGLIDDIDEGDVDEPAYLMEVDLFRDVGELGLECLHWFAMHEDNFHALIMEQQAREPARRCPLGRASAECVKILCEHYKISQNGHSVPTTFQLFLLNFSRLHQLVLRFFLRMWHESGSKVDDLGRVTFLVRSQIRLSLADEATKTWLHLERDFLETPYATIRERQMEVLEKEDGTMNRPAVKLLREKLNAEAQDVMMEQRIGCMLQGAWFNAANLIINGLTPSHRPSPQKPFRFVRLSTNRKTLAWDDFPARTNHIPAVESLREKIDIGIITSVRGETSCAVNSRSPNLVSKYSLSILSGELSVLDLDAIHVYQFAEWADGVRALGKGGRAAMAHKESLDKIKILADVALKVRLLDITGDGIEVPEKISIGQAPKSTDFWFA